MRAPRRGDEGLARAQADFLLGLLQENAQLALQDVERVGDVVVVVPADLLLRRELQLGDAESRPRRVLSPAFDLARTALVPDRFHAPSCRKESHPGSSATA